MKLESQVCSLELAQKLKELGVEQDSLWFWGNYESRMYQKDNGWRITDTLYAGDYEAWIGEHYSAFTVAELGEMLLNAFIKIKDKEIIDPRGRYNRLVKKMYSFEEEANARAKMLIYLLENKLITL